MDGLDLKARRDGTDKASLLDLLAETERELIEAQEKLEEAHDLEAELRRCLRCCVVRLSAQERRSQRLHYSAGLRAARLAIGWSDALQEEELAG